MEANKRHNYLKFNSHWIISFEIFYFEKHLSEFICSEFTPFEIILLWKPCIWIYLFRIYLWNLNRPMKILLISILKTWLSINIFQCSQIQTQKNQLLEFQIKCIQVDQIRLPKFRSQIRLFKFKSQIQLLKFRSQIQLLKFKSEIQLLKFKSQLQLLKFRSQLFNCSNSDLKFDCSNSSWDLNLSSRIWDLNLNSWIVEIWIWAVAFEIWIWAVEFDIWIWAVKFDIWIWAVEFEIWIWQSNLRSEIQINSEDVEKSRRFNIKQHLDKFLLN